MPSSPSVSHAIFDWLRSEKLHERPGLGENFRLELPDGVCPPILGFRGSEGLNETYCFDLIAEFDEQSPSSFRPGQLGQRASLFFETPGGTRVVHGVILEARLLGTIDTRSLYHLSLQPQMAQLRERVDTRIFQGMTVPQVVAEVLNQHGVAYVPSLARNYSTRRYCLQYQESDLAFVQRLLKEEGIFYFFEHPCDAAAAATLAASAIVHAAASEAVADLRDGKPSLDGEQIAKAASGAIQPSLILPLLGLDALGIGSLQEVLVMGDSTSAHSAIDGGDKLEYQPLSESGALDVPENYLQAFVPGERIASTRSTVRSFDRDRAQYRPAGTVIGTVSDDLLGASADLVSLASDTAGAAAASALGEVGAAAASSLNAELQLNEFFSHGVTTATDGKLSLRSALIGTASQLTAQALDAPGLAEKTATLLDAEAQLETYEHHGPFEEPEASLNIASQHLEQHRAATATARLRSFCRRLLPGRSFELGGHVHTVFNRRYTLVRVLHQASNNPDPDQAIYRNEAVVVPDDIPYRPPRPARRVHQCVESGVVVGPEGSEIHTNKYGDVKVQFHWDRHGSHDEHSSCWIRAMQPWAGAGYGMQFIPRVGMEVLVSFIGGDVDRPVVMGCLPNLNNPTPQTLPEDKNRSVLRTRSTPGGEGFNELVFGDQTGNEFVSLRAENEYRVEVGGNHGHTVNGSMNSIIEGDRSQQVHGSQELEVGANSKRSVAGSESAAVAGHANHTFGSNREVTIFGEDMQRVQKGRMVDVVGRMQTFVRAGDGDAIHQCIVEGRHSVIAKNEAFLVGGKKLVLGVGKTSITLTEDEVLIRAPKVRVVGEENFTAKVADSEIQMDGNIELMADTIHQAAAGADLKLTTDAELNGTSIRFGSTAETLERSDDETSDDRGQVTFRVKPPPGASGPLVLRIVQPNGEVIEKTADANNEVRLEAKPGERFTLLEVIKEGQSTGYHSPQGSST